MSSGLQLLYWLVVFFPGHPPSYLVAGGGKTKQIPFPSPSILTSLKFSRHQHNGKKKKNTHTLTSNGSVHGENPSRTCGVVDF